jgi:two-component system sensor kinase FixL
VHDLTERRRLERQILEVASNEQRRIGQDLHDGLCQDLVGVAFTLDAIARNLPQGIPAIDALVATATSVRTAAGQARDLSHGLNPVDVRGGGVAVALENLAKKVSQSFGVDCTFHSDPAIKLRDDTVATHRYRIAQEAVSNAIRHGHASHVHIELTRRQGALALTVADNGVGIFKNGEGEGNAKPGSRKSRRNSAPIVSTGIGLQTMQYRARVIGGTFEIARQKQGGTMAICTIGREVFEAKIEQSSSANQSSSKRLRRR